MKKARKSAFLTGFSSSFRKTTSNFVLKKRLFVKKIQKSTLKSGYNKGYDRSLRAVNNNPALRPSLIFAIAFIFGFAVATILNPVNASLATTDYTIPTEDEILKRKEIESEKAKIDQKTQEKIATKNTLAEPNLQSGVLSIPKIGLNITVSSSTRIGNELSVPTYGVSSYYNLLMAHSSGVFANITSLQNGDKIGYNGQLYMVYNKVTARVSDNRKYLGTGTNTIDTYAKEQGSDTILLMTCSGYRRQFTDGTWSSSHRTFVYAQAVSE